MENSGINCSVQNCKHNVKGSACDLEKISVGKTSNDCSSKKDTECSSFISG